MDILFSIIIIILLIINIIICLKNRSKSTLDDRFISIVDSLNNRFDSLNERNQALVERINKVMYEILQASNQLSSRITTSIELLRTDNDKQLERIRKSVDETLQDTLEKRISLSFEQVSKQLEAVYKGLGEMHTLAKNVGDFSRLFTNVKTRGVWGELQAYNIISEILNTDQFVQNYKPKERSSEVVEFAIKLPGKNSQESVYLPIDSKFPREDYENYLKACESLDKDSMKYYQNSLKTRILAEAKDISSKYINPPKTTDFAILFLPTESLYAEIMSYSGFVDEVQSKYRVTIAGPTTLAALINSLQMGFKTLAVEKRSHEVWKLFASMKKQFGIFASSVESAITNINSASKKLSDVSLRTQKISARLDSLEFDTSDDDNVLLPE